MAARVIRTAVLGVTVLLGGGSLDPVEAELASRLRADASGRALHGRELGRSRRAAAPRGYGRLATVKLATVKMEAWTP
jgi:hypothetical protein